MRRRKEPVWAASVTVDPWTGHGWTAYGRADFIFVLFMHGYSIAELSENLCNKFGVPPKVVEDAIRFGVRRKVKP